MPAKVLKPDSRGATYVALLRGVNVGGKNKVPMRELALVFERAGCGNVTTYIQSGNAVFDAPAAIAERLPDILSRGIADRFGLRVPVVVRTAMELEQAARDNPFLVKGCDTNTLHVLFLADRPAAQDIAALDPERSPGDAFTVRRQEIYLRCPNGVGRSKLTTAYFDAMLRTTSTCRNWRTVLELVALASARPGR